MSGDILQLDPLPDFLRDPALVMVLDALPLARLVGGCVRDTLAGRPVADVDLAVPLPPDQAAAGLRAAGLAVVPTGIAHGTITAISGGQHFEITSLRQDIETDGRHARVAWTEDWQADAARRDFTFNALSMTRDGVVHDPFGGTADLLAGRVRFVGDPAARIREDHLRALRFFRFHARFGRDAPDPAALAAIADAVPLLQHLSPERVWSELRRLLAAPDPVPALRLMAQTGVLAAVLPEGADPGRLSRLVAAGAPPDPILRLAALLDGDAAALARRLRLSRAERERLDGLRRPPAPDTAMDDTALRQLLADTPAALLAGRAWLGGAGDLGPETLHDRRATLPAGRPRRDGVGRAGRPAGGRAAARHSWLVARGWMQRRCPGLPHRTGAAVGKMRRPAGGIFLKVALRHRTPSRVWDVRGLRTMLNDMRSTK